MRGLGFLISVPKRNPRRLAAKNSNEAGTRTSLRLVHVSSHVSLSRVPLRPSRHGSWPRSQSLRPVDSQSLEAQRCPNLSDYLAKGPSHPTPLPRERRACLGFFQHLLPDVCHCPLSSHYRLLKERGSGSMNKTGVSPRVSAPPAPPPLGSGSRAIPVEVGYELSIAPDSRGTSESNPIFTQGYFFSCYCLVFFFDSNGHPSVNGNCVGRFVSNASPNSVGSGSTFTIHPDAASHCIHHYRPMSARPCITQHPD